MFCQRLSKIENGSQNGHDHWSLMIVCLKNWLDLNDIAAAVEIGRTKVKKKTPVTATS